MVAWIVNCNGHWITAITAKRHFASLVISQICRVEAVSFVLVTVLMAFSAAVNESSASAAIEPGDTVASTSGQVPLLDGDHPLLTLSGGEQSIVEGVLGKFALLGVDRGGKWIRGWALLENLTMVKRHNANTTAFCDQAGNVYYCVRLAEVTFLDGNCPWNGWQPTKEAFCGALYPRITLDGAGEAYIAFESADINLLTTNDIARSGWLKPR